MEETTKLIKSTNRLKIISKKLLISIKGIKEANKFKKEFPAEAKPSIIAKSEEKIFVKFENFSLNTTDEMRVNSSDIYLFKEDAMKIISLVEVDRTNVRFTSDKLLFSSHLYKTQQLMLFYHLVPLIYHEKGEKVEIFWSNGRKLFELNTCKDEQYKYLIVKPILKKNICAMASHFGNNYKNIGKKIRIFFERNKKILMTKNCPPAVKKNENIFVQEFGEMLQLMLKEYIRIDKLKSEGKFIEEVFEEIINLEEIEQDVPIRLKFKIEKDNYGIRSIEKYYFFEGNYYEKIKKFLENKTEDLLIRPEYETENEEYGKCLSIFLKKEKYKGKYFFEVILQFRTASVCVILQPVKVGDDFDFEIFRKFIFEIDKTDKKLNYFEDFKYDYEHDFAFISSDFCDSDFETVKMKMILKRDSGDYIDLGEFYGEVLPLWDKEKFYFVQEGKIFFEFYLQKKREIWTFKCEVLEGK